MTEAIEPDDDALRESVLVSVLAWSSIGGPVIVGLFLLQAFQSGQLTSGVLWPSLVIMLMPLLRLLRRVLSYRQTARAFLAYLFVMSTWIQCTRGLTPGVTLASVVYVLLAALFFGRRGGLLAFVATLVSLGVAGLISSTGVTHHWDAAFWDPTNPLVWLRYAAVLFFLGGALLSAFLKLEEGLSLRAAMLRETLQREREEHVKLERLQEALERAHRLEALAQFAGGLAHDFNNNLMVTLGSVALIRDEPGVSQRVVELAEGAASSVDASAKLVQQLLSLGRKNEAPAQRVQLGSVVSHARSTLRKVLPEGVELRISGHCDGEVLIDVAGLSQCLLNLTLNARDALGSAGHYTLHIEERGVDNPPQGTRARPGRYAVVRCSDTGCGIDDKLLPRLFEPFFTTKTPSKGTGLGLATIQRYMDDAGGFITVESKLGAGTTFALYLPVCAEPARSLAQQAVHVA